MLDIVNVDGFTSSVCEENTGFNLFAIFTNIGSFNAKTYGAEFENESVAIVRVVRFECSNVTSEILEQSLKALLLIIVTVGGIVTVVRLVDA